MEQKFLALAFFGTIVLLSAFIVAGSLPAALTAQQATSTPTQILTVTFSETGTPSVTPQILSRSESTGGIGGKTVTFTGGGVSGGVAWSTWRDSPAGTEPTSGGCPGAGRVQVYGTEDTLLGEIALPLQTPVSFTGVRTIRVIASAPLPAEPSNIPEIRSTYVVDLAASVIWEEE
jgi:hypothetical protein